MFIHKESHLLESAGEGLRPVDLPLGQMGEDVIQKGLRKLREREQVLCTVEEFAEKAV